MKITSHNIIKIAKQQGNKKRALGAGRYFKTGPGEYGEGDIFCGLTVPQCRMIAKKFSELPLSEIQKLLRSEIHEVRLIALLILVGQYAAGSNKKELVSFYLKNTRYINNWDLVDVSAHKILGDWFLDKRTAILGRLAASKNIWERRIAVLACFPRIAHNDFRLALALAEKLLADKHDLMHKAVGWMLRELGKKSIADLRRFLDAYASTMPRTMLRYAIEKLPPTERKKYLAVRTLV